MYLNFVHLHVQCVGIQSFETLVFNKIKAMAGKSGAYGFLTISSLFSLLEEKAFFFFFFIYLKCFDQAVTAVFYALRTGELVFNCCSLLPMPPLSLRSRINHGVKSSFCIYFHSKSNKQQRVSHISRVNRLLSQPLVHKHLNFTLP